MAILITGANGFVGRHLVSYLEKDGNEVVVFDGDISDKTKTGNFKCEKKIDAVIHLAGVINGRNKKRFWEVNTEGTEHIVNLAKKINAGRLIFLSSVRVLSSVSSPYSASKKEAENVIVKSGLPYIILRPSVIYGPGDRKNIGLFLKLAGIFPIMPVFDFKMQPLFVEDLVRAIAASLKIAEGEIINIPGPEIISFGEFLKTLKSFGFDFYTINMPRFFNFLLQIFSYCPFFPFRPWQVKNLLASEIVEDRSWQKVFDVSAISFDKGILKTLNYSK